MKKRRFKFFLFLFIFFHLLINSNFLKSDVLKKNSNQSKKSALITIGLGSGIEARFGHTLIHLRDKENKLDHTIDWGIFSFNDPMLPLNFTLGRLKYWTAAAKYQDTVTRYSIYYPRSMYRDELKLSEKQENKLTKLIKDNLKEENKYFWYDYFFKNCSTIPRDHLNQVLHNQIYLKFSKQITKSTFRDYIRNHLDRPGAMAFLLDLIMNARIDYPISAWEEMYYPLKLREHLLTMPAVDDFGFIKPQEKLIEKSETILSFNEQAKKESLFRYFFLIFSLGLIFLSCLLTYFPANSPSKITTLGRKILNTILYLWILFSSFLGLFMSFLWLFSENLDFHHSINLLIFWPIDFIMLGTLYKILNNKRISRSMLNFCYITLSAHLFFLSLYSLCSLSGLFSQASDWSIKFVVPVAFTYFSYLFYRCFLEKKKVK